MEAGRDNHLRDWRRAWRRIQFSLAASCSFALLAVFPAQLNAQQPPSALVALGNAAVTGFSGALPPIQIASGVVPGEKTFIDLNGPSLRVVDLQHMGGPPMAQFVGAPKPFTFSAAAVGQVFGVALDDDAPPNIYVAASSAYGLPIVAPGPDGQPQHIKVGAPNAAYMRGLWGPKGGPGSIWKIDGTTGKVSLFANVTLDGRSQFGRCARWSRIRCRIQNRFLSPTARPVSFIASGWTAMNSAVTTTASPAARRKGCRR